MNGLSITLIGAGIFLILVGVALLVIRFQKAESESFTPIFQGPGRIMVSGPVGLVVIVIGVFCLITSATVFKADSSGAPGSAQDRASSAPGRPAALLLSPASGTSVSRSQGFTASGSAAFLGSDSIWILDYDGGFTVDQEAAVADGRWSAVDQPLGDSSDKLPFGLTMVAVLSNPKCSSELTETNTTSSDYLSQLPAGCQLFGEVTVKVANP